MGKVRSVEIYALVVDDNEVNTLVLANMLELFGIRVDQIYSGAEAVEKFKNKDYNLIFVDQVMPDMDGEETIIKIRSLEKAGNRSVIFVLTSHVTAELKAQFAAIGADDVLTKPLMLTEVTEIIKEKFPQLSVEDISFQTEEYQAFENNDVFQSFLEQLPEINYERGMKYAIGNPVQYAYIVKVSVKDINFCINEIEEGLKLENLENVRISMHSLKSIFSNIGAIELYEKTSQLYSILLHNTEYDKLIMRLSCYVLKIIDFNDRLKNVMREYEEFNIMIGNELYQETSVMPDEEYEQCLLNTIYYIKSFEYDAIIKELQKLINYGYLDFKNDFLRALDEIKDFNYDNALEIIMQIKR